MPAATIHRRALALHRDCVCAAVRSLAVELRSLPTGVLAFDYVLAADMERVRIPSSAAPQRVDGLWRHTCFEAFVRGSDERSYCELNFAPSGEWAAYRFEGYRQAMRVLPLPDPAITVRRSVDRLELAAIVRPPEEFRHAPLRVALSAIVEEMDGRISYWAVRHPAGKPDFHHADAFALEL